ncbi:glycosyltransferase [Pseudomonas sp. PDM33]|uniref:glycosyltransferase n=1 Tax=unclassified Pseudomonas TaxID=196821 RepID=UPI00069B8744|nr:MULTISPECIES: glycosyltransferase [unclassified Pseudomonas]MBV7583578.1 glycosyltransferase [Pseudomonas sp. PDM33]
MRIVVDMQGAQTESRFRGIGRYTLSFTQALVRNRGDHEIILALSGLFPDTIEPIRDAFHDLLPADNIRVWNAPGPVQEVHADNQDRRDVAELVREAFLASLKPDVIHVTSLFEGFTDNAVVSIGRLDTITPVTATLYDLIPLLNPDQYLRPNPDYGRYYERKIGHLGRAAACLAISEFARNEGLQNLSFADDGIINMSTAIEADFHPLDISESTANALKQKFGLTRPFLLYAGGADERKNLPRLIQAFAALPPHLRTTHQLLLAGKISQVDLEHLHHHARLASLGADELIFTGYVSNQELHQLYNLCHLFVFPSWHEGFGLPALEAMACGAAVIAANTSSLPEVIGREDALFDPLDVHSIAGKIAEVLESEEFRADLQAYGQEQRKRFSWDKTAGTALKTFENLYAAAQQVPLPDLAPQKVQTRLLDALGSSNCVARLTDRDQALLCMDVAQNHPSINRIPQLFVDISELVQRDSGTGIQRVTRSILRELLVNPPAGFEVRAVQSSHGSGCYHYADGFVRQLMNDDNGAAEDSVIEPQSGDLFLGLDLQPQVIPECREYYRHLRNIGVQVHFVVYDLLPVLMPHAFPTGASESHARWLEVVIENDGAICISKAVADELSDWMSSLRSPERKPFALNWFHLGADIENSIPTRGLPANAASVLKNMAARPSFLMVGTVEPRKGYGQALAAFEQLWREGQDVALVIVGKRGWEVDSLATALERHPEQGKRLFWLSGVSDEYLERIYAESKCLLMASEGEGFGLPLIEAARHHRPIVARDIPVFREVAGDHAHYFSGTSAEHLAGSLTAWLDLNKDGLAPSSEGITHLNWAQSAEQLLDAVLPPAPRRPTAESISTPSGSGRPLALVLAPYPIRKPRHGGQLRTAAICQRFREHGFDVRSIGFYQSEAYRHDELSSGDIAFPSQSPYRLYKGRSIPELSDFLMASFATKDEQAYRHIADSIHFPVDAIVVEQPWFYPLAKRLQAEVAFCKQALIVFSSQNIEAPMKQQILEGADRIVVEAIQDISSLEQEAAHNADLSVAVTDEDADVLRTYGADAVLTAPNGINPWSADPQLLEHWRARLPQAPWPLFVASAHPPNYTGFIASVGDALACIPPGSRLVIAGGVGPHLERILLASPWGQLNASRLQILGVLDDDDLIAVKHLAHTFLLPIGGGGGSNIKTAEALYSGKPVICTSTALRGFEQFRELPGISVADSPQAFQELLRHTLAQDGSPKSGREVDRRLRQRLTWAASLAALPERVKNLLNENWKAQ